MALTYKAIATTAVTSSSVPNITFSSIPQTYTDLLIKVSARNASSGSNEGIYISFNGDTSSFSTRWLDGTGQVARSGSFARYAGVEVSSTQTANTFSNDEIYIPNYTSSNHKMYRSHAASENNATMAFRSLMTGLWTNTAAITSIALTILSQNFTQHSTATLYGIKKD